MKVVNLAKIAIGLLFLVTVIVSYLPIPEYIVELTCISNSIMGLIFIIDGLVGLFSKKHLPGNLYYIVAVTLTFVLLVCAISLTGAYKMSFKGGFLFLHVINPIVAFSWFILTVRMEGSLIKTSFFAPLLVMLYLCFDCIYGIVRGSFVYGFIKRDDLNVGSGAIIAGSAYLAVLLIGYFVIVINKKIQKNRNRLFEKSCG